MDEDDRLRFLFAKAFETSVPTDDCPSPEVLLDAYHRQLPAEQAADVLDHISTCALCAEAWRIARQTPPPMGRR
jgi:hypothetical protein